MQEGLTFNLFHFLLFLGAASPSSLLGYGQDMLMKLPLRFDARHAWSHVAGRAAVQKVGPRRIGRTSKLLTDRSSKTAPKRLPGKSRQHLDWDREAGPRFWGSKGSWNFHHARAGAGQCSVRLGLCAPMGSSRSCMRGLDRRCPHLSKTAGLGRTRRRKVEEEEKKKKESRY